MEPMYLSIQQKETGRRIKKLLCERGYTVKDVQSVMGFENPQAVYKWMSGKSLPSLDNFIILSRLLHTSIEDILVIDGDILFPRATSQVFMLAWILGDCLSMLSVCLYGYLTARHMKNEELNRRFNDRFGLIY